MQSSNIIISGGTGFIGSRLSVKLAKSGYKIYILSRDPKKESSKHQNLKFVKWDLNQKSEFYKEYFEKSKAVINLAGASIGKRWTKEYKKELYDSRINTTKKIVDIISICKNPPECMLSASGANAYKDAGDEIITESSPTGDDFLANLCKDWESEANKASSYGTRVIISRNAVVLDKNEGALPQMATPMKFFVGGWQGNGKQFFPWIHIDDILELYAWAIDNDISGVMNSSAPEPVRNKEFCKKLAKALHRPCWTGIPEFMLKIALGEFAESLLVSLRVIPEKALSNGFKFKYPDIDSALKNIYSR